MSTHPVFNGAGDLLAWRCFFSLNAYAYVSISNRDTGAHIGGIQVSFRMFETPMIEAKE